MIRLNDRPDIIVAVHRETTNSKNNDLVRFYHFISLPFYSHPVIKWSTSVNDSHIDVLLIFLCHPSAYNIICNRPSPYNTFN